MTIRDRVHLAREAYDRAIRRARVDPTRTAWRRLLRAARNLAEAVEELQRAAGQLPTRAS